MWKSSGLVLLRRSLSSLQNQPLRFKWENKMAYFHPSFFSTDSSSPSPSPSPSSQTQSSGGVEGEPISFSEAKKLMRLVNVEALKRKLGMDGDEVISYSQLLKACESMGVARSHDEAVAFTRILDEAGVILLFRDKVYLHPDKACIQVCPKNPTNFNVDKVRVAKLVGGGVLNSTVVRGVVLTLDAVGSIWKMEKAKIAVFAGDVEMSATTTTEGTVLIQNAEQLENYEKEFIKAVADSGAKVIVFGGAVGKKALQMIESYNLMVLKISSVFELQRFCRTTGAVALLKLSGQLNPADLGYADSISVEEVGGAWVTIVKNEENGSSVSTLVLRGSTDSILDDLERAVDDGVNTYRTMCRDSRIVPGAAATEIELARRLKDFSLKETRVEDRDGIVKFAECFEKVPKMLAENAGLDPMEIISSLYAEHEAGNTKVGIDLEEGVCKDVSLFHMWDIYFTKLFDLKSAADAAISRLCTLWRQEERRQAKKRLKQMRRG